MARAFVIGSIVLLPAVWLQAQTAAWPEFEVASIKPDVGGECSFVKVFPDGRLTAANMSMFGLLIYAYNLGVSLVSGGPTWFRDDHYDVTAKAEGKASPDEVKLMIQSILADRLNLAVQRETKEAPIYELTPTKGGLKLTPTTTGSCATFDRDHPPATASPEGKMNYCGYISMGRGEINAMGVPMTRFTDILANLLGRTVVDKTGVAGTYNIRLEFTPDQAIIGAPGGVPAPPLDTFSPNIFTALQEQSGIQAESAKGPVEMLVIDHVERPSEN